MRPSQIILKAASGAILASLLASCQSLQSARQADIPAPVVHQIIPSIAPASAPQPVPRVAGIDGYKVLVAEKINTANPDTIFSGRLPPMLPAIVVVNISIDKEGAIQRVVVQRSRDDTASEVALASVRRAAPYPRPLALIGGGSRTLDFSETFLFNRDYRFQLRTLAGPQ